MVHVVGISKAERKRVLKRVNAFRAEFEAKPEHAINLNKWYMWYSPLMKMFAKGKYPADEDTILFSFFGVTKAQADTKNLFTSRLDGTLTNKAEGLQRLDKLIVWHKKKLAKES